MLSLWHKAVYSKKKIQNEELERIEIHLQEALLVNGPLQNIFCFKEQIISLEKVELSAQVRLSEFAELKKDNIQWQERRLVIYGKGGPYGKKTKRRIIPMTEKGEEIIRVPLRGKQ